MPAPLVDVNSLWADEYDAFLSADARRLYFSRDGDIRVSERPAGGAFAVSAPALSTPDDEADPFLSDDELLLLYGRGRGAQRDVAVSWRGAATAPFPAGTPLAGVNAAGAFDGDPWLEADGCTLWFVSARDGGPGQGDSWRARVLVTP